MSAQQSSQTVPPGQEHIFEKLADESKRFPCPDEKRAEHARDAGSETPPASSLK